MNKYNYTWERLECYGTREHIELILELQDKLNFELQDKQKIKKQIKEWERAIDKINSNCLAMNSGLDSLANETMAINM